MKLTMKNLKILSDVLLYDPDKMRLLYKKDPLEGTIYNITLFIYNNDVIALLSRDAPFMFILSKSTFSPLLHWIFRFHHFRPRSNERSHFRRI